MAKRTPKEILEQRDAWLARKADREAGKDVPLQVPLNPGQVAEALATEETVEVATDAVVIPAATAPVAEEPQTEVQAEALGPPPEAQVEAVVPQPTGVDAPQLPAQKRSPPAAPVAAAVAAVPVAKAAAAPKAKAVSKPRPSRRKKPAPPAPIDPNVTRRELLNYAWLASLGLFTAQSVGATLWFAFPNFKAGEFGGEFNLGPVENVLPEVNSRPVPYAAGKFWLVNVAGKSPAGEERKGIMALFKVCTHLGCLYDWADVTVRFECPCHGSRFTLAGDYLAGPARRSLDRFVIKAYSPDDLTAPRVQTNKENGDPLEVEPSDILVIDTGEIIPGSSDIIPA